MFVIILKITAKDMVEEKEMVNVTGAHFAKVMETVIADRMVLLGYTDLASMNVKDNGTMRKINQRTKKMIHVPVEENIAKGSLLVVTIAQANVETKR